MASQRSTSSSSHAVQRPKMAAWVKNCVESYTEGSQLDPSSIERGIVVRILEMNAVPQMKDSDGFQFALHEWKIAVEAIEIIQMRVHSNTVDKIKCAARSFVDSLQRLADEAFSYLVCRS